MQAKLNTILEYVIQQKSPHEQEWDEKMLKMGLSPEECLADEKKMDELAKVYEEEGEPPTAETKAEIYESIEEVIQKNNAEFEKMLNAQTAEIKESTDIILTRFDAGPHERIHHPVVRHIWKEMVRSTSSFSWL